MKILNTKNPMKNFSSKYSLIGLAIIFTVIMFLSQCEKDPYIPFCELHPDQCEDMERIKDHYYFKTGSWWVYQEVNSHQLDSQWVSKGWVNDCKFRLTIKTTLDDYDRERWTHLLTPSENCGLVEKRRLAYIERSKTKAGGFIGTSYIGIFYPVVGDSLGNYGGGYPSYTADSWLRIRNVYESYSVLNTTYSNVIEISDDYNAVEHSQPTTHWYAEGVGLIKKELIDSNQTWLLIKYNVEQ